MNFLVATPSCRLSTAAFAAMKIASRATESPQVADSTAALNEVFSFCPELARIVAPDR